MNSLNGLKRESLRLRAERGEIDPDVLSFLLSDFEQYKKEGIPPLTAAMRETFERTGEREPFEVPFFLRRHFLCSAALLTLLYPDAEYPAALCTLLDTVLDEPSWASPAHTVGEKDISVSIDLFAAELGGAIATILYLLKDVLPVSLQEKAAREVRRRIITPFENRIFGWEDRTNNWSSVCAGNVGTAMMLLDPQTFERQKGRILASMNCFLNGFSADGACLEGLGYWQYGFGNFLCFADLYRDYSGENLFADKRARAAAAYPYRLLMIGNTFPTVSDSSAHTPTNTFKLHCAYAGYLPRVYPELPCLPRRLTCIWEGNTSWNGLSRALLWSSPREEEPFPTEKSVFLPAAGQAIENREHYSLFVKAGHNDEPHNHNDVGSFIFATKSGHALCDIGAGRYTESYFKDETRYERLCTRSGGHSVPLVNGQEQRAGREFFGTLKKKDGAIVAECSAAYGQKDFTKLLRTFVCEEKSVRMTDEFSKGAAITERFVTFRTPKVEGGDVLLGDAKISCSLPLVPVIQIRTHELQGLVLDSDTGNRGTVPVWLIDYVLPSSASRVTFTFEATE